MPGQKWIQLDIENQGNELQQQADEIKEQSDLLQVEEVENFFDNLDKLGLPSKDNTACEPQYRDNVYNIGQSLNRIKDNQAQIDTIRTSLLRIISIIAENPSILSNWSKAFGEMNIIAKIGTGAAITLSPLAAIFAIGGGPVIATSAVLGGLYTGLALLFENHNSCSVNTTEKLEDGVNALVDMLAAVINELNEVSGELKTGVDDLNNEVTRLNTTVDGLNQVVDRLTGAVSNIQEERDLLNGKLITLQEVSDDFERRGTELEAINGNLSSKLDEFEGLNQKYLDRNIEQDEIISKYKILLVELESAAQKNEMMHEAVKQELAIRDAANLDFLQAQAAAQEALGRSADEIKEDAVKFAADCKRRHQSAKIEFTELTDKISKSAGELENSQNVIEKIQLELEISTIKLSATEAKLSERSDEFKVLEEKYQLRLKDLELQIDRLTKHNTDIESGKHKVRQSMVKTYHAGQGKIDKNQGVGGIFGFFNKGNSQHSAELPVAIPVGVDLVDERYEV